MHDGIGGVVEGVVRGALCIGDKSKKNDGLMSIEQSEEVGCAENRIHDSMTCLCTWTCS